MTAVRIVALAEAVEWLEPLVLAHHAAWQHLFGAAWSLDAIRAELRESQDAKGIPATWVAVDQSVLIGSVSLLTEDAPELQHFGSPWLGNLWVDPARRGAGWGRRLLAHAVASAAAWRVPRLLLFTPDHAAFYTRLGWHRLAAGRAAGSAVDVMQCDPAALHGAFA